MLRQEPDRLFLQRADARRRMDAHRWRQRLRHSPRLGRGRYRAESRSRVERAGASGDERDLLSWHVLPAGFFSSNWKIGTASSNQDNHLLSGECRIELDKIVVRLPTMY